jgi:hypothetical protein
MFFFIGASSSSSLSVLVVICTFLVMVLKRLRTTWLVIYNEALGVGSIYVMFRMVQLFSQFGIMETFRLCWTDVANIMWILQGIVAFDVAHAFLGVWSHEPSIPLLQRLWCKVGHRSELFITIYLVEDKIRSSWALGFTVFTWLLADVSRYQLYTLRTLDITPPYWLVWCRYSDFIIQYPLNILAEAALVITAVPFLIERCTGPNCIISYAPVAILFNLYEWVIFVPAYKTLWSVRKRRLTDFQNRSKRADNSTGISEVRCADVVGGDDVIGDVHKTK